MSPHAEGNIQCRAVSMNVGDMNPTPRFAEA